MSGFGDRDPALMIAEMSLLVKETPDLSASLIVRSGPRMSELQKHSWSTGEPRQRSDTRGAQRTRIDLQLSIGPNVFGPTPLVMPD